MRREKSGNERKTSRRVVMRGEERSVVMRGEKSGDEKRERW